MQTSVQLLARWGSATTPGQQLQRAEQPAVTQQPRLRPISGQRTANITGHRLPLPLSNACRQHVSSVAATHTAERVTIKHHVRGWSSTRRGSRFSLGSTAAASDESDNTAIELSSSSEGSSSEASASSGDSSSSDAEPVTPRDAGEGDSSVATIQLDMPRRSMQVTFTCDKCGARTSRMVNPLAWDKGLVLAQCSGCEAWHKLRDAGGLVQEIRYIDEQP